MNDEKSLTLNDFASFDRLVFFDTELSKSERVRWEALAYRLYDEGNDELLFPIDHEPKTIEEHQLCHYVLWMVIWAMRSKDKPLFFSYKNKGGTRCEMCPLSRCFACSWRFKNRSMQCPIKAWRPCTCHLDDAEDSPSQFYQWADTGNEEYAYEIAHLKWTKEDEEDET